MRNENDTNNAAVQAWKNVYQGSAPDGLMALLDEISFPTQALEGTTKLLRRPSFQEPFTEKLIEEDKKKVLIVGGSIGSEAYTLAILAHNKGHCGLQIDTLDLSPIYTEIALNAVFGKAVLEGQSQEITKHFKEASETGFVTLSEDIQKSVHVLDAQDIFNFKPDEPYDAVICQNLICHLDPNPTATLVRRLAQITKSYLCFDKPEGQKHKDSWQPTFKAIKKQLSEADISLLAPNWKPLSHRDFYPDGTRKPPGSNEETVFVFEKN